MRRGERVPDFIAGRPELQRAAEGRDGVGVAAGIEIQLADRRMRLCVAPIDQHDSHQLRERIVGAALCRVGRGKLFVDIRIVRVDARCLSQCVDRAGRIAFDLRQPRDGDE